MIRLAGYFSADNDKPAPTQITASISGIGMSETLTLDCQGGYRVSVQYRPIERIAHEAIALAHTEKTAVEQTIKLMGQDSNLRKGQVVAYLRADSGFVMLTLDFMSMGQISAPFVPIAKMVNAERGTFA